MCILFPWSWEIALRFKKQMTCDVKRLPIDWVGCHLRCPEDTCLGHTAACDEVPRPPQLVPTTNFSFKKAHERLLYKELPVHSKSGI